MRFRTCALPALALSCAVLMIPGRLAAQTSATPAAPAATAGHIHIGFLIDALQEERWQRDLDAFQKKAESLGATVELMNSNNDGATQLKQGDEMIAKKPDVIVIVPHDSTAAAAIVNKAHAVGIPVLSYDRLILNSPVSLYVGFDNAKIGEAEARSVVARAPKGEYLLIEGSDTDSNAKAVYEGQMKVLQPLIDSKAIHIADIKWTPSWDPGMAYMEAQQELSKHKYAAIIVENDGMAGGVEQALEEKHLDGKVPISGQDADLAAVIRVLKGEQAGTVYKPVAVEAGRAAEAAVALAEHKDPGATDKVNNGAGDIPAILLEPIVVNKGNVLSTVVADGFQSLQEIHDKLPKSEWPESQAQ